VSASAVRVQVNRSQYFRRKISASKIKSCLVGRKKITLVMHKLNRESDLMAQEKGATVGMYVCGVRYGYFPYK